MGRMLESGRSLAGTLGKTGQTALILILLAGVPTSATAQVLDPAPGATPAAGPAPRPMVTVSDTERAPVIDGRLDDTVWLTAVRIDQFTQQRPREGVPASEQTEVYLAYDSRNIYVGIHAHYSDPKLIRANRAQRDQIGRDDTVSILFDTFRDQQRAYVFSVNGYGVQGDSLLSGGGGGGGPGGGGPGGGGPGGGGGGGRGAGGGSGGPGDSSWNALFSSAGLLVADGWTAELAIPFKSLRYPAQAADMHRWGFQIQRDIESKNESVVWSPVLRNIASFLGQMGTLEGLTGLSSSRSLEIMPTVAGVRTETLDPSSGTIARDRQPDAGVNVKYGVTSNLTLNFTLNPDFSQIEADRQQIQVNQRFPLFYSEQRPFFLEGQEIFSVGGPATFIHTRTIVNPQVGAKLSGKTGKTTLGLLVANDEAPGQVSDATDPAYGRTAQFVVGRVRYDLYSESSIGAVVTNRDFLDSHSRAGGLDGRFKIGRTHRLSVLAVFSDHKDASGVRRTGHIYSANFSKEGRGLTYSASTSGIDPNFRTDVGFVRRTDIRTTNGDLSYRWYPNGRLIVNWGPRLSYGRTYNYAGELQDEDLNGSVNIQFARNISVNTSYSSEMERYRSVDFRKSRLSINGNINASRRISFGGSYNGGDQIRYVESPFLGRSTSINASVGLRLFSRLESQVSLNTSQFTMPTGEQLYSVRILRASTSVQVTDRLTLRNIIDHNAYDRTFGANLLATYRVDAGTVFFVGYDDRYRQEDRINSALFPSTELRRTNRAIFLKLQYLLRM